MVTEVVIAIASNIDIGIGIVSGIVRIGGVVAIAISAVVAQNAQQVVGA